jgi:hypothetical protein
MVSQDICEAVRPGIGCGTPEMLFLGILYALVGFLCLFFLVQRLRSRSTHSLFLHVLFLTTMTIWLLYRAIITIVPFDYSVFSLRVWVVCVNSLLLLLPLSCSILIQCTFLFLLRDPGVRRTAFFRVMFLIFLIAFILIAIVVIRATSNDPKELDRTMALWQSATDVLIFLFSIIPGVQLYRLVIAVKLTNRPCLLRFSKYGLAGFFFIYAARVVANVLTYFTESSMTNYLNPEPFQTKIDPGTRAVGFAERFLLELTPAVLVIGVLRVLRPLEEKYAEERRKIGGYSGAALRMPLAAERD